MVASCQHHVQCANHVRHRHMHDVSRLLRIRPCAMCDEPTGRPPPPHTQTMLMSTSKSVELASSTHRYHQKCFVCVLCHVQPVTSSTFLIANGGPVCTACSPTCAQCGEVITENHIAIKNEHFRESTSFILINSPSQRLFHSFSCLIHPPIAQSVICTPDPSSAVTLIAIPLRETRRGR